ncbi:ABC transporter substrate-binding protein [Cardinium endosymbiont of Culicoides punctatus]|uniref:ABC transporter substrate-binding protein n=1 Tax=Cardinium endosymbiont of Culicoides punctatus TaxID=2304601 RepID=UPI001058A528|nr:ABC transporter substrate-binding protein [Cardinium endosymbiont of Culicoides punctatus]TDG95568.1 Heme-binding protein A [Cardinium endosymbiont of Culicoides punctatus]
MSKRIMVYLMVMGLLVVILYNRQYKRKQFVESFSILQNVTMRPIDGMDPLRIKDVDSAHAVSKIYEGLYEWSYLERPFKLVPNLAEGMPIISTDGLIYTFKVKKGILFQDDACFPNGKGRELKAADVVFSLKRVMDPKNAAPYVDFFNGKIQGLDVWRDTSLDYEQAVEGLKALDDYTLQVTLTQPWSIFLDLLAHNTCYIVPKEAVIYYGSEFLNHPVGTGPFMLQNGFNPQEKKLEFIRNPNFREKLFPSEAAPQYQHMLAYAGRKLPLVDKVITYVFEEEQPRFLKIQNAEIDIDRVDTSAFVLSMVKDGKLLPEFESKGLVFYQEAGSSTEFFTFNHNHDLFKNLYLRQAMSLAFDRDTYNQLFYNGVAEVAHSLVPLALLDPSEPVKNPYAYDVKRARDYLTQAGYPDGKGLPVITLDVRSETAEKNKADFFAKCMAQIGIQIQVITNTWPELCNKIFTKHATMMHALTWHVDYPEASSCLELVSNKNLGGLQYENTEFNKLYSKAKIINERETRCLVYTNLSQATAEEVPMICAVHRPIQFLHHKWIKNFVYSGYNYGLDQYIAVDMKEKNQFSSR